MEAIFERSQTSSQVQKSPFILYENNKMFGNFVGIYNHMLLQKHIEQS